MTMTQPQPLPAAPIGMMADSTEDLDLASLLCARLCHDLVSPVGAINNGLELITGAGGRTDGAEMQLVSASAEAASSALKFFRLAFGRAQATETLRPAEVERVVSGHMTRGRFKTAWTSSEAMAPKPLVRLSLNMMLMVASCLPRGGLVTATLSHDRIEVRGEAERISVDAGLHDLLGGQKDAAATASNEAPVLLSARLAAAQGMTVTLEEAGAYVLATAS